MTHALLALIIVPWCVASVASAQDLEPRAYTNTPVGINFLVAGYAYQMGDVVTDAAVPLEDGKVHVHGAVLAYARSFGLFGKSSKLDVIVPYGWASGSAKVQGQPRDRYIDGFGDPRFRLSVNFYGAPAITMEEFESFHQDVVVGASLQIVPPLGQYDPDKLLNIGTNRWAFKPEMGISKTIGPASIEVQPSIAFYTDNDDFLGGKVRKQNPIYAVQGHLVYRFGAPFWASLDGTFYGGGKTTVDGVENDDRQANARIGLTAALSLTRHNSIKLYASKSVATRIGGDFDLLGIAYQLRWGGGL
jgi:Putative MetA-pathway of phenol degradation